MRGRWWRGAVTIPSCSPSWLLARGATHAKVLQAADAVADDEEALALLEAHAQAAPARIVQALHALASALAGAGRSRDAIAAEERALPLAEKTFGALHPTTIAMRVNLGVALATAGERRRALPILRRALADRRAALGPDHLDVARASGGLGTVLNALGEAEEAVAAFAEAIAIVERKLGKDHPELIANTALLSEPLSRLGRFREAQATIDRSEALARKSGGEKSGLIGFIDEARAGALEMEGRTAEAMGLYEQAASRIKAAVPTHRDVAACQAGVARQLRRLGRADEALPVHTALLAETEKLQPAGSAEIADRLVEVGDDLIALHREPEAARYLDRALKIIDPQEGDPLEVAEIRFSAARAFFPADRKRALGLANEALTAASTPRSRGTLREDLQRWLADRAPQPR